MKTSQKMIFGLCLVALSISAAQAAPKPAPSARSDMPPATEAPAAPVTPTVTAPSGGTKGEIVAPAPTAIRTKPGLFPVAGPAPGGVSVIGTPSVATVHWIQDPNVKEYRVWRGDGANASVEITERIQQDGRSYDPNTDTYQLFVVDEVPDARVTYTYAILAYYPNGTSAEADVKFTSPPLINPPGFTARDQGDGTGTVLLQWQGVPGAAQYRLDGPGLPNTGFMVGGTQAVQKLVAGGPQSWRLVTLYPANYADYAGASIASTIVHALPPHSQPWISKGNPPEQPFQVQSPAHQEINDSPGGHSTGNPSGDLFPIYDPGYLVWLAKSYYTENNGIFYREYQGGDSRHMCSSVENVFSGCLRPGLKVWLDTNSLLWDEAGQAANEAVYGNPGDLGVGRRAYCEQKMRGPPVPGLYTVCYATAHGSKPGEAGFNDPQKITHPQEGVDNEFILSMVITKDASGTTFLAIPKPDYRRYSLLTSVGLDTEGPKLVPFVCTSCHGGKYNPSTRKVDGSSFLPIDPELMSFASAADQAVQEEKIRKINLMILNSNPTSQIAAYIRGLYNNAQAQPGTKARPDYVPAAWAPQSGFYRQVVRPYCTMCHLAVAPDQDLSFTSWTNFQGNGGRILAAVCGAHTMPHSEVQYRSFWLKDTGSLYMPGVLAATLGSQSCP